MSRYLNLRALIGLALVSMLLLGGSIYVGVNVAVERAVIADGKDKAAHWADYFLHTMPDLDRLLADGQLRPDQIDVIKAAERLGDVFRFKLFDLKGDMMLVSDETTYATETVQDREHSGTAAGVLQTSQPNIAVKDGTGKQNRPPLYVEAYVPIIDETGGVHGVVEVYIDQTGTAGIFRSTFAALAVGLAVVAALAFGLPTIAFLFRGRNIREAKQRVEFLAHHDPMTELINRTTFNDRLQVLLDQPELKTAVVFFDVDDFKAINDTFGHEAGDEFLKHVARCMRGLARADELVARPGGDEFTVALTNRTPDEVATYVEAVLQAVRQPITIRGKAIGGCMSAGIYLVDAGASLGDAMHKADIALYQAKIDGRNTYRLFTADMEAAMTSRRALEQLLREATASRGFEVHFQPLLHVETKRCAGFEALLRLPDGKGGLIPPGEFIPVAESMGLINEIGVQVLDEATRVASTWPGDLFVAVNLSARQFFDGKLVDHVRSALAASGLPASRLELEITESMLIENSAAVGEQLRTLRALGVSIAMDDFGTGYSSLGYLWQFGFDKLKIDRSFVNALDAGDPRAREIVDTIIMLGHKLEMTVTAEGIETEYHASVLSELACDHFQGYLYGRPAPARDLAAMLADQLQQTVPRQAPVALRA